MILYLFKSTLCLAVLLLVYLLFLEKEKMHRFNRWYLLGSIVFACMVPLISIQLPARALPVLQDTYQLISGSPTNRFVADTTLSVVPGKIKDYQSLFLVIIYSSITLLLLLRFTRNIYRLSLSASKNRTVMYHGAKLVLLKEQVVSHTFLNNIFISESDYTDQLIEQELITHELTHVKQKHSLDVIFVEFLQAVFWFNPLFILYKKAIQLNHEFLADDAVIEAYEDVPTYQLLLLEKISLNNHIALASPFNFSVTKKRLVMMTRTTHRWRVLLKKLVVIPIFASAMAIVSTRIVAQNPAMAKSKVGKALSSTEEGISKETLAEYDAIVKKNMTKTKNGRDIIGNVTEEERSKLESIYKKMSKDQQEMAKVVFKKRLGPWQKEIPTANLLETWKDGTQYGLWIDEKRVSNQDLNKYNADDFSHYSASKLSKTAINYGKHYVQIDLMTNAYYDKYYKSSMAAVHKHENNMLYRVQDKKNWFLSID